MLVHQRVSGKGNLQQLPGYPISWSSIFPGFLSATPSHCFTGFWHMANGRRLTIFQVMLFLANKIVLMGRESLFSISSSRTCRSSYPASLDQWNCWKLRRFSDFCLTWRTSWFKNTTFVGALELFLWLSIHFRNVIICHHLFFHSVGNNMNNHPIISILLFGFHIFSIYWECHHPNWRTHSLHDFSEGDWSTTRPEKGPESSPENMVTPSIGTVDIIHVCAKSVYSRNCWGRLLQDGAPSRAIAFSWFISAWLI